MKWQFNDGGRAAAGYKGQTRDCVVRAICIASGMSYRAVYDMLAEDSKNEWRPKCFGRRGSPRTGIAKDVTKQFLQRMGWTWHATMGIGTGCTVHLRDGELPMGKLIVSCSRHMVAVINGVAHDIFDPTRDGKRCVYGYWTKST